MFEKINISLKLKTMFLIHDSYMPPFLLLERKHGKWSNGNNHYVYMFYMLMISLANLFHPSIDTYVSNCFNNCISEKVFHIINILSFHVFVNQFSFHTFCLKL